MVETSNTDIHMAGKIISMADFKQAILLKRQGKSNRAIATLLGINKEMVNFKFAFIRDNNLSMDELIKLDDPELTYSGVGPPRKGGNFHDVNVLVEEEVMGQR